MLIRLVLLGALIIALTGRCERPDGEAGGELAISLEFRSERQNVASLSDLLPKPMLTESGPALVIRTTGGEVRRSCEVAARKGVIGPRSTATQQARRHAGF